MRRHEKKMRDGFKIFFAVGVLSVSGCATTSGADSLPIIDATLAGGKVAAGAVKQYAVSHHDTNACYVAGAFEAAIGTSQVAVDGWLPTASTGVIPGVTVDVSVCLSGTPAPLVSTEVQTDIGIVTPAITGGIGAILSMANVSCRDKAIANAVLTYIQNAVSAVLSQLVAPSGTFALPMVPIDGTKCPTAQAAAKK